MMHSREKSDSAIVAGKPTNKAVPTAAEPVERRAGAKGWSAYGKSRRKGRRRGSSRSFTTSASTCLTRRSTNSRRMPPPAWTG